MPLSVLRSGALRLAAMFALLFAAAAIVYVTAVHLAVRGYARTSLETAIEAEIALVRGDEASGRAAMLRYFERSPQTYFSFFDPHGARLAGTLPPRGASLGWSVVLVANPAPERGEEEPIEVLTRGVRLNDGSLLVVGRSLDASAELVEWLDATALWSGLGIVILALGGGWLIASVFLRRLDRVNTAIDRIMAGAFTERLPPIGMGVEFDTLAARLNTMLDRIIALMDGHRHLSTNLAHDLRTPLTRVHQRLERARDRLDPDLLREATDGALHELDEVLATFSALLRLGTIETGVLRTRFRAVDLAALLHRIESIFAPVAEDRGKSLVLLASPSATILGDAELLTQLVTNLVENALIHTGGGTRITMAVGVVEGEALVAIADDGPGIPAAERQEVTRRFYRLEASRETPGAGLGLSLADAIVKLHDGRMELADNGPGLMITVGFPLGRGVPDTTAGAAFVGSQPDKAGVIRGTRARTTG